MNRNFMRLCQVFFNRMQLTSASTLTKGLSDDSLWKNLSGREHQLIGKTIAKYSSLFEGNCPCMVNVSYKYTDNNGRGIYR